MTAQAGEKSEGLDNGGGAKKEDERVDLRDDDGEPEPFGFMIRGNQVEGESIHRPRCDKSVCATRRLVPLVKTHAPPPGRTLEGCAE